MHHMQCTHYVWGLTAYFNIWLLNKSQVDRWRVTYTHTHNIRLLTTNNITETVYVSVPSLLHELFKKVICKCPLAWQAGEFCDEQDDVPCCDWCSCAPVEAEVMEPVEFLFFHFFHWALNLNKLSTWEASTKPEQSAGFCLGSSDLKDVFLNPTWNIYTVT